MTYTLAHRRNMDYFLASSLERFAFLRHAFCTRRGGVSKGAYAALNMSQTEGDDPETVRENWKILAQILDFDPDCFFSLRQVHGRDILVLDRSLPASRKTFPVPPACDAVITDQPDIALCVKTADCVPIFIVDAKRRVIANVHAGWKGTVLNIAGKVVSTFEERFGSRLQDLIAVIGPAIGFCCYEVDASVMEALGEWRESRGIYRPSVFQDRWMLDLPRLNREQLVRAGLSPGQISGIDLCTSCRQDMFFSHRRDRGNTGRQVNVIMLRESGPDRSSEMTYEKNAL